MTIPSISSNGEYAIYAYANNNRIAKLNLFVYDEKDKEVVVVPIVNTTIDSSTILSFLDETLGEANISFSFSVAPQWNNEIYTRSKSIQLPSDI